MWGSLSVEKINIKIKNISVFVFLDVVEIHKDFVFLSLFALKIEYLQEEMVNVFVLKVLYKSEEFAERDVKIMHILMVKSVHVFLAIPDLDHGRNVN